MNKVRTRFAPSPTGYLHIGGVRTALYSWLYARHHGGDFILRIEDTDLERSTQASVDAILEGMHWLGLSHDEGPFYQTQRFDRYNEIIDQLLANGQAYHCYCSKEELDVMREEAMANKQKPRYDGRCRHRTQPVEGVTPVVRFRNPDEGSVVFEDQVYGRIEVQNSELDDLIIRRSDGAPTYNLTVVVDDWDMQISHVIRGDDHINNTPRQINLYRALNAEVPIFAHLPMILGGDGKRLSKRHGAVSVLQYQEEGFLPEALLNYLVRLGWSHGDQEIFSIDEMTELFRLDAVSRGGSTFDTDKLSWVNQQYIKNADVGVLVDLLAPHLSAHGIQNIDAEKLKATAMLMRDRANTLVELAAQSLYFFQAPSSYDEKASKKHFKATTPDALKASAEHLQAVSDWCPESIDQAIHDTVEALGVGFGKVGMPLRLAMTGQGNSPSMGEVMTVLGQEETLNRIHSAINFIESK